MGVDLLVGVPREDLGSVRDAGVVEQISLVGEIGLPTSRIYRQHQGGRLGSPEAGDRFGSSIAAPLHTAMAVGVPGEDVGDREDAGAVSLFYADIDFGFEVYSPGLYYRFHPVGTITQNSRRVPGTAERGDKFGGAVEELVFCPDVADPGGEDLYVGVQLAIGASGEDVGAVDAGTVTLYDSGIDGLGFGGSGVPACPSRLVRQGAGASGRGETGDRFGADLELRARQNATRSELLIAVPGEDVGAVVDAGLVNVVEPRGGSNGPAEQFTAGPRAGLRYGVLS